MAKIINYKSYNSNLDSGIGTNSVDFNIWELVSKSGGFIAKSWAGDSIIGISETDKTMASDNQTVAQERVIYTPIGEDTVLEATITGGTITQSDEGKYFDIDASQDVDGTTESTTTGQVEMVKFISATKGHFKVVNL